MIRSLLIDLLLMGVLFLLCLLLGGCALHTPMSQTLTFHADGATQPSHRTHHGIGLVGTAPLSSTPFLRREANRQLSVEEAAVNDTDHPNLDNRSLAL